MAGTCHRHHGHARFADRGWLVARARYRLAPRARFVHARCRRAASTSATQRRPGPAVASLERGRLRQWRAAGGRCTASGTRWRGRLYRANTGAAGPVAAGRFAGPGATSQFARHHRRPSELAAPFAVQRRQLAGPDRLPAPPAFAHPLRKIIMSLPESAAESGLPSRSLRATLRLQFHRDFTFAQAFDQLDYYASLGVSHLYASPVFTARSGSVHGY